jgi:CubicO group peptidase (beta-lactamase class C family)
MPKLESRVHRAIEERVFPGCVVGVILGSQRTVLPFGSLTYTSDSPVVSETTVYDVASVTKSIPTASLVLDTIAAGHIELTDRVVKYLPHLQNHFDATIEDLLRYRVQGIQMSALSFSSADIIVSDVFASGFSAPAGESRYTNLPAYLLGLIVERVLGEPLDAVANRKLFSRFHMDRTSFFPDAIPTEEIAPTEIDTRRGILCGLPHDESAYVFAQAKRAVGHAGLFSTAPDLLNFLESLLAGEALSVLAGAQRGLGWQLSESYFMGTYAGTRTFGKTGFTGCSIACDIDRGVALVILSNRTYPKRPLDAMSPTCAINIFRSDIADIVLGAVV